LIVLLAGGRRDGVASAEGAVLSAGMSAPILTLAIMSTTGYAKLEEMLANGNV
jgi:hypothetical protein